MTPKLPEHEPYKNFIHYLITNDYLNKNGTKLKPKKILGEEIFNELNLQIFKLTDFLVDIQLRKRLHCILYNVTKDNYKCPVENCKNIRCIKECTTTYRVPLICKVVDKEHHNYRQNIRVNNHIQTNLEKYGVKWPRSLEIVKNKAKQTSLKRYGTEYPCQSPNIREKIKRTNLERYGFEVPLSSKTIQAKVRQTNLARYGAPNPGGLPQTFKKIKETNLKKYGADHFHQRNSNYDNIQKLDKELILSHFIDDLGYISIDKLVKFTGNSSVNIYKRLRNLGVKYKYRNGVSAYEDHVMDYLKILDPRVEMIRNSRKIISPLELDIYLPEYNLAVEINGLAFHSEGESACSMLHRPDSDPERHLRKLKACLEKGIDLVQAFNEVATFEQLAFEKLLAYKMGKLKWPTNQRWYKNLIKHDLLNGWPDHLIEMGYEIQEVLPPVAHWFELSKKRLLEEGEEGNFNQGHRKFYDCGHLILQRFKHET